MPVWGSRHDSEGSFWSKVDKSGGPDACWPWMAAKDSNGYGAVKWSGKKVNTHRVVLELKLRRPIQSGMVACHTRNCTTRLCCNPDHLYEGTQRDNVQDAIATGSPFYFRSSAKRGIGGGKLGAANAAATLDEATVLDIDTQLRAGECHTAIATATGATKSQVKDISSGRTWGWLTNR